MSQFVCVQDESHVYFEDRKEAIDTAIVQETFIEVLISFKKVKETSIYNPKKQVEKLKVETFVAKQVPAQLDKDKFQNKGKEEEFKIPIVVIKSTISTNQPLINLQKRLEYQLSCPMTGLMFL